MAQLLLFFLTHFFGPARSLLNAQAVGDRSGFLNVIRNLRGLLGNLDPSKVSDRLLKLHEWLTAHPEILGIIKKFIGGMLTSSPAVASAHALSFNALSDGDFEAAGIRDNIGGWMALVSTLMALARLLWGDNVLPFAEALTWADVEAAVASEEAASPQPLEPAAPAPAPGTAATKPKAAKAPAAPVDANAS